MVYAVIIAAAIIADQLTKWWVCGTLLNYEIGNTIPILQDWLHLTYHTNTGGAWSFLQEHPEIITVVSIVLAIALTIALIVMRKTLIKPMKIALALIIGGAIGNIIDRAVVGFVHDFIDFRIINFPVFNVADICVVCGAALLALMVLMEERKAKKNEAD